MTVIDLAAIVPYSTARPKGLVSYRPNAKSKETANRIVRLYREMYEADALPLGPRQVGYRLKEHHAGEYTKADFKGIETIVRRLQQDGQLPFSWVADASAITHEAGGWDSVDSFLTDAHTLYHRDCRDGQPTVIEVPTEARETLPLIHRLGRERGVAVYSGGGSCGPNLAHKTATRAVKRAVQVGQSTLLLGLCDFDQAGVRNVLRPHLEHISAFLFGTAGNDNIVAIQSEGDELVSMPKTHATVSFQHLALTPEQALGFVETSGDHQAIRDYIDSGEDMWDRDLGHLDGVQKIETEALDPVDLRQLVIDAIDSTLDHTALQRVVTEETTERSELHSRFSEQGDLGDYTSM